MEIIKDVSPDSGEALSMEIGSRAEPRNPVYEYPFFEVEIYIKRSDTFLE
jgi:hypothetical protein